MNASLYVARADGDREFFEDCPLEAAREVFEKMNWDAELDAVAGAEKAGKDVFFPEYGITDAEERTLVIAPVDPATISFQLQSPGRVSNVGNCPRMEAARLIGLFYEGFCKDIEALIAKPPEVREVPVRELSDAEFRETMTTPMHRLPEERSYRPVHLRDYLHSCIIKHSLPVTLGSMELTDVYLSTDKRHSHIVFNIGEPFRSLILVVRHNPDDDSDGVYGHHFGDPGAIYA